MYKEDQVFSLEENSEQLWFPSSTYRLHNGENNTDRELLRLRSYYRAMNDFLVKEVILLINIF